MVNDKCLMINEALFAACLLFIDSHQTVDFRIEISLLIIKTSLRLSGFVAKC